MAPTSPPEIVVATTSDSERVVALLGLAFSSDPILRWLYPDPLQFDAFFPELTMALGGAAFESGSAYRTGDFSAAALWLPSGVHADEEVAGSVLERSVPEERSSVVFGILEQMEENHPSDEHWYLPWIGVDPIYQGRGLGTAVLQHTL